MLWAFAKLFVVGVALMFGLAWYLAPADLGVQHATRAEGRIERSTIRRIDRLRIDTPSRVYGVRCERAQALCQAAQRAPGSVAEVWVLESGFANENWVVQARIDGQTVTAAADHAARYAAHREQAQWLALGSAAVALAVVFLLPSGRRPPKRAP